MNVYKTIDKMPNFKFELIFLLGITVPFKNIQIYHITLE